MTDAKHSPAANAEFAKLVAITDPSVGWSSARGGLAWQPVLLKSVLHVGALAAFIPSTFSWGAAAMLPLLWWISGGLGVCLGYHRLLSHRSFKTSRLLERTLATFGALCLQGGPLHWVGFHRMHHAEADGEHDPHSPKHGLAWSHVLWYLHRRVGGRNPLTFTRDLTQDPYLCWLDRWWLVPQIVLTGILFGVGFWATGTGMGALGYVIWGISVRTVFGWHATWFVNSAAHTWGYRNFRTDDESRNNWWVALLTFGEGWHNNHHAQQRSAAHGMRWWEIDPTWWTIRALERVGLVHSVVRPKLDRLDPHR